MAIELHNTMPKTFEKIGTPSGRQSTPLYRSHRPFCYKIRSTQAMSPTYFACGTYCSGPEFR